MRSGLLRAIFVMKEIKIGKESLRGLSPLCGPHEDHHWINVAAKFKLDRTAALFAGCQVCTAGAKFVLAIGP